MVKVKDGMGVVRPGIMDLKGSTRPLKLRSFRWRGFDCICYPAGIQAYAYRYCPVSIHERASTSATPQAPVMPPRLVIDYSTSYKHLP
jgi:hypothetical protein